MDGWRQGFHDDVRATAPGILGSGVVPGPPIGPFVEGRAYPVAVDLDGNTGAVSYVTLDAYPDIAPGWWCVALRFTWAGGVWHEITEDDNSTTQRPFERTAESENSIAGWVDWHSNGATGGYEEPGAPLVHRHLFFGIAPVATARLTVTDEVGRERDLSITPWCGGYVAAVDGAYSRLTGYDEAGELLGSFVCLDGATAERDPEPPPGWERVEGLGNGIDGPKVHRRIAPVDEG
jgi:hypothetical protein